MPDEQIHLFPLSDEEWRERSKRLASLIQEYKRVEENKKTLMKEMTETLKQTRKEIEKLADAVSQGKEWRTLVDGLDDLPESGQWDR